MYVYILYNRDGAGTWNMGGGFVVDSIALALLLNC